MNHDQAFVYSNQGTLGRLLFFLKDARSSFIITAIVHAVNDFFGLSESERLLIHWDYAML